MTHHDLYPHFYGAGTGTRTPTSVSPLEPESSASTSSAIPASLNGGNCSKGNPVWQAIGLKLKRQRIFFGQDSSADGAARMVSRTPEFNARRKRGEDDPV